MESKNHRVLSFFHKIAIFGSLFGHFSGIYQALMLSRVTHFCWKLSTELNFTFGTKYSMVRQRKSTILGHFPIKRLFLVTFWSFLGHLSRPDAFKSGPFLLEITH